MSIELLWLIPILAFAFFVFLVAFFAQRRNGGGDPLAAEVARFNTGKMNRLPTGAPDPSLRRLDEIEGKLSSLTGSISGQQSAIDQFQLEARAHTTEITDLRKNLSDLHKEYDLVLSENYSLRAKLKLVARQMEIQKLARGDSSPLPPSPVNVQLNVEPSHTPGAVVNTRLYDDTRVMNALKPDDTDQLDLAGFR